MFLNSKKKDILVISVEVIYVLTSDDFFVYNISHLNQVIIEKDMSK